MVSRPPTIKARVLDIVQRLRLSPGDRLQIREIGLWNYIRYRFSQHGTEIGVTISGVRVTVRSGTPDLQVALTSLKGEFDSISGLFPRDWSGAIVDAGGYIGTASLALRKIYPFAKIICVEPSWSNLKILRKNLSHDNNIEIIEGALVGQQSAHIELQDRGTGEWGYSVVPEISRGNQSRLHPVRGVTLTDLGVGKEDIGIIKLDIEGGEMELLELDSTRLSLVPIVIAELHEEVVPGCTAMFKEFSSDRRLEMTEGEKWLSIRL